MPKTETPEWLTYTPDSVDSWQLQYWRSGQEVQFIEVTREEFIALKRRLAKMRGVSVADPPEEE